MERNNGDSSQALDFTKGRTGATNSGNDDMFPFVLDLSIHHSDARHQTKGFSDVMGRPHTIQSSVGSRLIEDTPSVAEDLRVSSCSSIKSHLPTKPEQNEMQERDGCIKQPKLGMRILRVDDTECGIIRHAAGPRRNSENEKKVLSFNFKQMNTNFQDDDACHSLSKNASSSAIVDDVLPAAETRPVHMSFFEKSLATIAADAGKKHLISHYCGEASLSEVARSSFGVLPQSEDSEDVLVKKRYDEYAKQFADFLKSTSISHKTENDSISNSEESQASEAFSLNIANEECASLECTSLAADCSNTNLTVSGGLHSEDASQEAEAEDTEGIRMEVEECNDESLLDSKSESVKACDSSEKIECNTPAGEKKRKRKTREVENSESVRSKKRKVATPITTENDAQAASTNAANVFEYQWPQEKNAEWFVLQEHISEFLGVLSFKRKYPDIFRRAVDINERNFLQEHSVVTEMQCDLGLTALKTDDVCDLMSRDYPEKYQEFAKALTKRQKIAEAARLHDAANAEKTKMENMLKKSVNMAAEYNAGLMRELRQERRAYFDLQTFEVHYPRRGVQQAPKVTSQMGSYPVALLPGQYQDYYKRYTQQELNYFPINTALYSPHKMLKSIFTDPNSNAVEDTEDDDGPEETNDHISISKEKHDEKVQHEVTDPEKQKSSLVANLDQEDNLGLLEDSEENSRSSFKDGRIPKTILSKRRMQRFTVKKKGREVTSKCGMCGQMEKNKDGESEDMVHCSECSSTGHPSCLELTKEMVAVIKTYPWQCMECKTCVKCMDPHDEEKMMFCDHCDRGYHTFCVGLKSIPDGRWECPSCRGEVMTPAKPKRGRPFKYPRPHTTVNHVTPKTETTT